LTIGSDLSVRVSSSVVGRKLEVGEAVKAAEKAMADGVSSVDLPVTLTQPKRTEKDLEEARIRLVKLLSGPVALEFEGQRWSLSPKEIASLITVEQKPGLPAPVVSLKEEPLQKLVKSALPR
jgi:hypothetical protein